MTRSESLAGRVVLVVEDDWFVAEDIVAALVRDGAVVASPVPTLAAALELLRDRPVDLAVLDVRLTDATVYQAADALAARGVPFAFATGYDRAGLPPRFADAPLWEKPFDTARLARFLATMAPGRDAARRTMGPPDAGDR